MAANSRLLFYEYGIIKKHNINQFFSLRKFVKNNNLGIYFRLNILLSCQCHLVPL